VEVSRQQAAPTLKAQDEARKQELKTGVRGHPLVQAVLERFPGAEIVDVRKPATEIPDAANAGQEVVHAAEEEQQEEVSSFGLRSRPATRQDGEL
jgi:DNA polymerase-3 subunit gamma/tau